MNAHAGMVLEGKGSPGMPSGLVSCSSNPREMGAEVEPRCVDHTALQSQVRGRGAWGPSGRQTRRRRYETSRHGESCGQGMVGSTW